MYISLDTDKDCDLLQGRPVLWSGRTPNDKTSAVLTKAKLWSRVLEGLDAKTDGLTD